MKRGDPITIWVGGLPQAARVVSIHADPFEYLLCKLLYELPPRLHGGNAGIHRRRLATEGIEWLPGHGPEIEAALDAAHRLLDDDPTVPFQFPRARTWMRAPCNGFVSVGAVVSLSPMGTVQAATGKDPALGYVAAVHPDNTVDVLIDSTAAVNLGP